MLTTFLIAAFVVILSIVCCADRLARLIIFHPEKYPAGNDWNPEGFHYEEVTFPVGKRDRKSELVGWYFPRPDPKSVILYCHGNGGNITLFPGFAELLRRNYDASVLVFDYRGYGKSDGTPTTSGILEDGRAALRYLAERENISEKDIVVWGQSLGGSVAIDLASTIGTRGLIVESAFTSLPDMSAGLLPGIPAKYLLWEQLSNIEKIKSIRGPVFISHGKADEVIPFEQGKRLFEAAGEPKFFYQPEPGEDEHSAKLGREHLRQIGEFLDFCRKKAEETATDKKEKSPLSDRE